MSSIRLFRGEFGHVSVLNVASNLVTHAHAEAHFIIWLGGSPGEMTVGAERVPLGPQAAVGVNSLQPHSHALPCDGTSGSFLAFYIHPEWARRRRGLSPDRQLFVQPSIPLDHWLHRAAIALFERLEENPFDELADYEIERFIDSLFDAADASEPAIDRRGRHRATLDYRVRKAIALMRDNVCERISLDEVARSVGLSRPHFFALFKEQTRLTPNVYWNTLRMEEALRQLRSTEEPLISVACSLGFNSPGNFTRFFRDHAGVPPMLYREASRTAA
ncbi:MAG: AraC family transcriptional regulator [Rhizobiaceae bacterium]